MSEEDLQRQIDDLKKEIEELKDFINSLYNMIADDDEPEEYQGGIEIGRYNT